MTKPRPPAAWPPGVLTLAIDVGGTSMKASVLNAKGAMITDQVKIQTPYPCTPNDFIETIAKLTNRLPTAHRVSMGFPGLVRHGIVVEVPSLSRDVYGGPADPRTVELWRAFDLRGALAARFKLPVKVANDADVQGCDAVKGVGFEFVMTLGTGVGTALFDEGRLLPHLELSHGPFRPEGTFDVLLGEAQRRTVGKKEWIDRVLEAIEVFYQSLYYDHIYVGGGNAARLKKIDLGPRASIVPNKDGILGGVRIWELDS